MQLARHLEVTIVSLLNSSVAKAMRALSGKVDAAATIPFDSLSVCYPVLRWAPLQLRRHIAAYVCRDGQSQHDLELFLRRFDIVGSRQLLGV